MKNKMKKRCVKILTVVFCMITLVTVFVVPSFAEYAPPDGLTEEELEIYNMGYQAGNDDGYDEGYDKGYFLGYNDGLVEGNAVGYETGYTEGYDEGYEKGSFLGYNDGLVVGNASGYESGLIEGHEAGYTEGHEAGYTEGEKYGWDNGFGAGQNDMAESTTAFKEMVFAIFDAPVTLIDGMLGFEIFGINMAGLVKTIITLAVVALIVFVILKFAKG